MIPTTNTMYARKGIIFLDHWVIPYWVPSCLLTDNGAYVAGKLFTTLWYFFELMRTFYPQTHQQATQYWWKIVLKLQHKRQKTPTTGSSTTNCGSTKYKRALWSRSVFFWPNTATRNVIGRDIRRTYEIPNNVPWDILSHDLKKKLLQLVAVEKRGNFQLKTVHQRINQDSDRTFRQYPMFIVDNEDFLTQPPLAALACIQEWRNLRKMYLKWNGATCNRNVQCAGSTREYSSPDQEGTHKKCILSL